MKTKIASLLLIFLLNFHFVFELNSQTWITQVSGTQNAINDICFLNPNTGFAACDSGKLLRTTNGGLNWIQVSFNFEFRLIKIVFLDQFTGFVINANNGGINSIYKSTNSGLTWGINFQHSYPQTFAIKSDSTTVVISCDIYRLILKTSNSGQNWNVLGAYYWTNNVSFFINSQTGWLCSYDLYSAPPQVFQGVLRKTTDGGVSWPLIRRELGNAVDMPQSAIVAFSNDPSGNNDTIIYVNYRGHHINKTTNSGSNWQTTEINNFSINDLEFINSSTGWGATTDGMVFKTTNCGDIWIYGATPVTNNLRTICFINEYTGWVAGEGGVILKTITGGPVSVNVVSEVPGKFELSQNYPNPFNPFTKIKFSIPLSREETEGRGVLTKLIVFDALGKEANILVDKQLQPGNYEADWDGSAYPSGVYFYRLVSGSYTETKKMVLLK